MGCGRLASPGLFLGPTSRPPPGKLAALFQDPREWGNGSTCSKIVVAKSRGASRCDSGSPEKHAGASTGIYIASHGSPPEAPGILWAYLRQKTYQIRSGLWILKDRRNGSVGRKHVALPRRPGGAGEPRNGGGKMRGETEDSLQRANLDVGPPEAKGRAGPHDSRASQPQYP